MSYEALPEVSKDKELELIERDGREHRASD
jgi:hypothetical protein